MIVKNEKQEVCVTVRIPVRLKFALEKMSEDKDWSLSHVVRHILMCYFYPSPEYIALINSYAAFAFLQKEKDKTSINNSDKSQEEKAQLK